MTDTQSINGKTYTSVYDVSSKTITETSPMGRQSTTTLDSKGKVISKQVAGLLPVNYGYDSLGRLNSITQGVRTYSLTYDGQNRIAGITDPLSRSIGFGYDLSGRVTQETMPDGRLINFGYDASGNVTTVVPPGKPTHIFDFTPMNLTKDYIPPDIGIGNVSTAYAYDLDRRPTEVDQPTGSSLTPLYDNTENTAFTYDGSLVTSITWSGAINGSVGFSYNNDFRVSSESVIPASPESFLPPTVNFGYDNDGLLTKAGDLTINRDQNNGLVTGTALGGVSDSFTYNGFGESTIYNSISNGLSLLSYQLSRDNIGRIIQKTETVNSITDTYAYSYDLAGRLTDVVKDGTNISHYDYDTNGNRLSFNGITGSYDAQDRLISYGAYSYTYTANGELASKTSANGITQYGYDNFGNLTAVLLPDGTRIEYVVDGQNRRVGKKVNGVLVQGFFYEGQLRPIAELDSNGNIISQFVYGTKVNVPDYMIKGGATYRIISDHLGSPRLVVDINTGVIIQRIDYDEFGNIINDSNPGFQPFGFAGGLYDRDTGLVRFGARDYDSVTGKWTAKDPILFKGGNANLYGYVNDPVNRKDVLGLKWSIGSSFSILFADYGWDTSNPSQANLSATIGQLGGAGWQIKWESDKKTGPCPGEVIAEPTTWNIGLGKYFGVSFTDDFSSFSFNVGIGFGSPITATLPLEGDYSLGGIF